MKRFTLDPFAPVVHVGNESISLNDVPHNLLKLKNVTLFWDTCGRVFTGSCADTLPDIQETIFTRIRYLKQELRRPENISRLQEIIGMHMPRTLRRNPQWRMNNPDQFDDAFLSVVAAQGVHQSPLILFSTQHGVMLFPHQFPPTIFEDTYGSNHNHSLFDKLRWLKAAKGRRPVQSYSKLITHRPPPARRRSPIFEPRTQVNRGIVLSHNLTGKVECSSLSVHKAFVTIPRHDYRRDTTEATILEPFPAQTFLSSKFWRHPR